MWASASIELAGERFNINSPKQLGVVLFTHMGLPAPVKYGKGKTISTAQDVLEALAEKHEVPRLVLEYRHLSKLKSNYIDALPLLADAESRVHTTFQAAATATGRLSSVNPNLQNIPIKTELGREIRAAFTAAPGSQLLSADYSQIELRLLAHFSGDPLLVRAYQNDEDIHTLTASEVFGVPAETMDKETRARAKAVNFGIVYGISAFGLAAQLGIPQSEARAYIERYFARYQGVQAFIEKTLAETRRDGQRADDVRTAAADSGHREPQSESARICGAHGGEHAAAGHGGRPDQAGDDCAGPQDGRAQAEDAHGAAGARRIAVRGSARRDGGDRRAGARRRWKAW